MRYEIGYKKNYIIFKFNQHYKSINYPLKIAYIKNYRIMLNLDILLL